ncbi:MAG: 30S ribosomal protein S20 [Chloroflexi bacterium]|nr:30S ribosomal protein S20 [Chloroflexota bacterium]
MANTKSAMKAIRVSARRRAINRPIRSGVKTFVTKAERLIATNQPDQAREAVAQAIQALDKAAEKDVIHTNNAARRKSRLMHKLNAALAAGAPA